MVILPKSDAEKTKNSLVAPTGCTGYAHWLHWLRPNMWGKKTFFRGKYFRDPTELDKKLDI